jgi:hypothetical protein
VLLDVLTRVGPETVERFAYAWYGPPRAVASADEGPGDVPEPLRRFYDVAARWPTLVVHNALVRPPKGEGDRVVFYVENQGLCSWMTIRSRQDDARVWAEVEGEAVVEEEPLSRFLVTVAILEAVFGSPDGASAAWLHRDRLSGDLGPLRLSFAPWHGFPEGATFYAPTTSSRSHASIRRRRATNTSVCGSAHVNGPPSRLSTPSWTKAGSTTRGASANATALIHGIGLILPCSAVLLGKSVHWVLRQPEKSRNLGIFDVSNAWVARIRVGQD